MLNPSVKARTWPGRIAFDVTLENPYNDETFEKTEAHLKLMAADRAARQGGLEPGTQRRRGR